LYRRWFKPALLKFAALIPTCSEIEMRCYCAA